MIQDIDGLDSRKLTVITASRLVLEKNTYQLYNSKRQTLNTIGRRGRIQAQTMEHLKDRNKKAGRDEGKGSREVSRLVG